MECSNSPFVVLQARVRDCAHSEQPVTAILTTHTGIVMRPNRAKDRQRALSEIRQRVTQALSGHTIKLDGPFGPRIALSFAALPGNQEFTSRASHSDTTKRQYVEAVFGELNGKIATDIQHGVPPFDCVQHANVSFLLTKPFDLPLNTA